MTQPPTGWRKGVVTEPPVPVRRTQRLHAAGLLLLPLLGTALAAVRALSLGVGVVEIGSLVGMYTLTMLGITVGFHRHFAHRAFSCSRWLRAALAAAGSMAAQGPLAYWVANHRRHHRFSDAPGDPHSPHANGEQPLGGLSGLWHAHAGWTMDHGLTSTLHYARDLITDKNMARIGRGYLGWVALGFALPAAFGAAVAGAEGAVSGLLWGGFVRLFFVFHFTAAINSVTHRFGSRPFVTHDRSTNNGWIAIMTGGESWHNNHHAFPRAAHFGRHWWQVDLGGVFIQVLALLGLAWDLHAPTPQLIEKRRAP